MKAEKQVEKLIAEAYRKALSPDRLIPLTIRLAFEQVAEK